MLGYLNQDMYQSNLEVSEQSWKYNKNIGIAAKNIGIAAKNIGIAALAILTGVNCSPDRDVKSYNMGKENVTIEKVNPVIGSDIYNVFISRRDTIYSEDVVNITIIHGVSEDAKKVEALEERIVRYDLNGKKLGTEIRIYNPDGSYELLNVPTDFNDTPLHELPDSNRTRGFNKVLTDRRLEGAYNEAWKNINKTKKMEGKTSVGRHRGDR